MSLPRRFPLAALPALLVPGLGACLTPYPQRLPGPLPVVGELPAVPPPSPNAPVVTVQRESDPVWVRRAGERGDSVLPFYRKRERITAGALVRTGAGGRAELLWAPDASALALFDEGRVTVGDPARDEPMLRFHSLTRAILVLTPEDRVELVGGAILAGDPLESTGTILLESLPASRLRLTNQSKRLATVAFRDERLEVGPGESIDLPVPVGGSAPRERREPERFELPGLAVAFQGRVERKDSAGGVSLTALEPTSVSALGIEARLEPGETVSFSGLAQVAPVPPADPSARP